MTNEILTAGPSYGFERGLGYVVRDGKGALLGAYKGRNAHAKAADHYRLCADVWAKRAV